MRRKGPFLLFLFLNSAFPQSWSGQDNFNSSVLDASKWTTYASIDGYPVSANLVKTLTGISFFSPDANVYERWGLIFWNQKLPINESWSAVVEASFDENYQTTGNQNSVAGMLAVLNTLSSQTNDLVSISLIKKPDAKIGYNYQKILGNSVNSEGSVNISSSHVILKLEFNSTTRNIMASYADAKNPDIFYLVQTYSTTNWLNLTNLNLCIGGYSVYAAINSNQLVMDNFKINRTTTNTYNTTLTLQETYDLFNWSALHTNYLYRNDPRAFYRIQIQKQ